MVGDHWNGGWSFILEYENKRNEENQSYAYIQFV